MQEYRENDIVYSEFGYGTILKSYKAQNNDYEQDLKRSRSEIRQEGHIDKFENDQCTNNSISMKEIQLEWGGKLYIEEKKLRKKIKLYIKTFYGNRTKIELEIDINSTIQQLKNILLESHLENGKTLYNLRLIYPMGFLNELSIPTNTIEQYKIPNKSKLILLVQTSFNWDPLMKGSGITLANNNLSLSKNPEVDYQSVLGNLVLSSGRNYWEIRIDQFNDEEDLFVGIARKNLNLYARPTDTGMFWGYMCLCGRKFGADGVIYDYGFSSKRGDTIGVLLEYKSGVGSLSFYRNGTKCGLAFSNLTGSFYPAVCMNYGDVQVTLDPKAAMPLS